MFAQGVYAPYLPQSREVVDWSDEIAGGVSTLAGDMAAAQSAGQTAVPNDLDAILQVSVRGYYAPDHHCQMPSTSLIRHA